MPAVSNPAFRGIQLEPVDGGEAGRVAELAQHQETRKHAAWLGVCTTIALLLELVLKTKMRRRKDEDTAEGYGGMDGYSLDTNDKYGRGWYIGVSGMMELVIFLVEDATTVFVWWQTGTYDSNSIVAQANLITTVVSAVGAATALLYGMIPVLRSGAATLEAVGIPVALFLAAIAFWTWFALTTIQNDGSYNCIGSCVANANATDAANTTTLAGSDALVLGSGSSFGSGESGAGEGGDDVGLNRAAIGVYVVGWIVAVLGGGFATMVAFELSFFSK